MTAWVVLVVWCAWLPLVLDDPVWALLRRTLDQARYPLAPRYDVLRAILAKLDPPAPAAERPPPIRPRTGRGRRR